MADAFDLAILGSGFGGSLLAMIARRLGRSVLLLERGQHPRFAIGESSSPLANLLLEELARRYDLPRLLPLAAWGPWKRTYPEIGVGLKRGFTFYGHRPGRPLDPAAEPRPELLVAASPCDEVADTHWLRADVDHFLAREAQRLGAELLERTRIDSIFRAGTTTTLEGEREGQPVRFRARFVVDASGARGALFRLLGLPEGRFPLFPETQALFSHFVGVRRFAELLPDSGPMPYPPDAAALHHLFPGGWMWVLRFDSGVVSAGIAVEAGLARELRLEEGPTAWARFLERFPSIREQFAEAEPIRPFVHASRLSFRCGQVCGPGWALLPSAAGFIDPLFSTGFPLTLLGIERLARALERAPCDRLETALGEYPALTAAEATATAALVAGCYALFADFPAFAALSMLYFVAASYAEMARRLGRLDLASGFLLQNRPEFRRAFVRHTAAAMAGDPSPLEALAADLEPFNIAGLCDPARRNRYGVDPEDTARAAHKLQSTPEAVRALFPEGMCRQEPAAG